MNLGLGVSSISLKPILGVHWSTCIAVLYHAKELGKRFPDKDDTWGNIAAFELLDPDSSPDVRSC